MGEPARRRPGRGAWSPGTSTRRRPAGSPTSRRVRTPPSARWRLALGPRRRQPLRALGGGVPRSCQRGVRCAARGAATRRRAPPRGSRDDAPAIVEVAAGPAAATPGAGIGSPPSSPSPGPATPSSARRPSRPSAPSATQARPCRDPGRPTQDKATVRRRAVLAPLRGPRGRTPRWRPRPTATGRCVRRPRTSRHRHRRHPAR